MGEEKREQVHGHWLASMSTPGQHHLQQLNNDTPNVHIIANCHQLPYSLMDQQPSQSAREQQQQQQQEQYQIVSEPREVEAQAQLANEQPLPPESTNQFVSNQTDQQQHQQYVHSANRQLMPNFADNYASSYSSNGAHHHHYGAAAAAAAAASNNSKLVNYHHHHHLGANYDHHGPMVVHHQDELASHHHQQQQPETQKGDHSTHQQHQNHQHSGHQQQQQHHHHQQQQQLHQQQQHLEHGHQNGYLAHQNGNNNTHSGLQPDDARNQTAPPEAVHIAGAGINYLSSWPYRPHHHHHHTLLWPGHQQHNNTGHQQHQGHQQHSLYLPTPVPAAPATTKYDHQQLVESDQHQLIEGNQQYTTNESATMNDSTGELILDPLHIEPASQHIQEAASQRYNGNGDANTNVLNVTNQSTSSSSSSTSSASSNNSSLSLFSSASSSSCSNSSLIDTNPIQKMNSVAQPDLLQTISHPAMTTSNAPIAKTTPKKQRVRGPKGARTNQASVINRVANEYPVRRRPAASDSGGENQFSEMPTRMGQHAARLRQSIEVSVTYTDEDIVNTRTHITVMDRENNKEPVTLTNLQLTTLTVRDLNKMVIGFPKVAVTKLKQRRRTLKNRGYAQNCRLKRLNQKNKLEERNRQLQEERDKLTCLVDELKQTIRQLRQENDTLRRQM